MDMADIARVVLDVALATGVRDGIELRVRGRRIDILVGDHQVTIEVMRGIVQVAFPDFARVSVTRPLFQFERVTLDDASVEVVSAMVGRALEAGRTPF